MPPRAKNVGTPSRSQAKNISVSEFSPIDVAGLSLWLAADTGTFQDAALSTPAVSDGDRVGGWQDQSGNGNHATQATASKRATLKLAIVNGKPIVRFDGLSHTLVSVATSSLASDEATIFAVIQISVSGDAPCGAFGGNQRLYLFTQNDHYTGGFLDIALGPLESTTLLQAGFVLQTLSGTSNVVVNNYINGVLENNASPGATTFTANPFYIGSANDGNFMNGDIAELLVYDSQLSDADRGLIDDYLSSKYSL